jgi:hypothetical protein
MEVYLRVSPQTLDHRRAVEPMDAEDDAAREQVGWRRAAPPRSAIEAKPFKRAKQSRFPIPRSVRLKSP